MVDADMVESHAVLSASERGSGDTRLPSEMPATAPVGYDVHSDCAMGTAPADSPAHSGRSEARHVEMSRACRC